MTKHDDLLTESRKITWWLVDLVAGDLSIARKVVVGAKAALHDAGKWEAEQEERFAAVSAALETLAAEQAYVTQLVSAAEGMKDNIMASLDEMEATLRQRELFSDETAFRFKARRWALNHA